MKDLAVKMIRRLLLLLFLCLVTSISYGEHSISERKAKEALEYVTPEEVGWSTEKLEEAKDFAGQIGSVAVMALYDGKVFFSWGSTTRKYMCHSIRKPFLSALYGIYVKRGEIDLELTLEELGIDDTVPSLTHKERQATVRDLLMSRSGVYHEAAAEARIMIKTRPERGSHDPGNIFYYNNWDFNVLGTIFEQQTGKKIFEAFKEEIADPIGMEDFLLCDCDYQYEPSKSEHPAYPFTMTCRDMARFGLLYQNNGKWGRKQIIPRDWIAESTTPFSLNALMGDGYGYMWSIIPEEAGLGHGFYHTGIGVHLLAVLPDAKLVLVHRVNTYRDFDIPWSEIRNLMYMIVNARL
jgi:CubicO group peptidase (beta-lactamase class C family)